MTGAAKGGEVNAESVIEQVEIDIRTEEGAWDVRLPGAEAVALEAARAALEGAVRDAAAAGEPEAEGFPDGAELSLVLADDALVRSLNRDYRGQDKATNVLSFASLDDDDAPLPEGEPVMLGDVILALSTTLAEARDQGKPAADHFRHLVVHGVLHLLGYDHMDEDEAARMEALETAILAGLGIPDPYAPEEGGERP